MPNFWTFGDILITAYCFPECVYGSLRRKRHVRTIDVGLEVRMEYKKSRQNAKRVISSAKEKKQKEWAND